MKRKIAESMNVRVNLGNFEHIELVKYAEEEIEYSTVEERIQKEDCLRDDLLNSTLRSLNEISEKVFRSKEECHVVEEKIAKKLPEWIGSGQVPNIAGNLALKKSHQKNSEIQAEQDKDKKLTESVEADRSVKIEKPAAKVQQNAKNDLFDEDDEPIDKKEEVKLAKEVKLVDLDEDDLFA